MNIHDLDSTWAKAIGQPWLKSKICFITKHGSHAYGTNIETSDLDIKGFAIPPSQYLHGFVSKWEQTQSTEPDLVIYEIRKFFRLAEDCNPNIIEVLWTDAADWIHITKLGKSVLAARSAFISKKARFTFGSYAKSQLARINTHYRWLKNPPLAPPTRGEFALPERTVIPADQLAAAEAAVRKKMDSWSLDFTGLDTANTIKITADIESYLLELNINKEEWANRAARSVGYDENFIRLLDLERQYKAKHNEWTQYQNWKATRNPQRAELEAKFGFDTKHGAHLVRLLRMCKEILLTGEVVVKRPDREELLAIRAGAWTYEQLIEWAQKTDNEMGELYNTSTLPRSPDRDKLDKLCIQLVEASLA